MPVTINDINPILKEDYQPYISDLLNRKVLLLNRIAKDTESLEGKRAYLPVLKGRNEAIGARAEGGTLPTPTGNQQYDLATFNVKYNYGAIKLTGPSMAASKGMESYISAVDSEVNGMVKDLQNDLNRQLYGNGTGVLTACGVTAASTTVVVSSTKFLRPGMYVDILTAATGADPGNGINRLITSVPTATTFVISGVPITTSVNEAVYRHGARANEMFGLAAAVSNVNPPAYVGNFGAIDRTTVTAWQSNVLANGGTARPLSLELMDQAFDEVDIQGDGIISLIVSDFVQRRRYAALVTPDRRFPTANGAAIDLDGGWKALSHDGVPYVADKDAPPNIQWGLDEETFKMFTQQDFQWMDSDGSILRKVPGEDAYEATLTHYSQLGNTDPRNSYQLADLL